MHRTCRVRPCDVFLWCWEWTNGDLRGWVKMLTWCPSSPTHWGATLYHCSVVCVLETSTTRIGRERIASDSFMLIVAAAFMVSISQSFRRQFRHADRERGRRPMTGRDPTRDQETQENVVYEGHRGGTLTTDFTCWGRATRQNKNICFDCFFALTRTLTHVTHTLTAR